EELLERGVIERKLLHIRRFARTERLRAAQRRAQLIVVGVGDVEIDDRNAGFQQRRDIAKRLRRRRIEAREAREGAGVTDVGDDVAVEIQNRAAGINDRLDVQVAKEPVEAGVAARLVRKKVGLRVGARSSAERAVLGAVESDAFKVGNRLVEVGSG